MSLCVENGSGTDFKGRVTNTYFSKQSNRINNLEVVVGLPALRCCNEICPSSSAEALISLVTYHPNTFSKCSPGVSRNEMTSVQNVPLTSFSW